VWHLPLVEWLAARSWRPAGFGGLLLIAAPASLALAFVSYRLIETPFLRMRRAWAAPAAPQADPPAGVSALTT
jgi:peptidoglycan/LPS O-acetylase OafA/YrhL